MFFNLQRKCSLYISTKDTTPYRMCLTNWILGSKNVLHGYNHRLRFRIYSKYVKWSLLKRKTQRKRVLF